jgi:hypothetical protein
MNGGFEAYSPGINCPALSLDLALVLRVDVYSLHDNPVFFGQHPNHLTALALVLRAAVDYFNCIAFFNLDLHGHAPQHQL